MIGTDKYSQYQEVINKSLEDEILKLKIKNEELEEKNAELKRDKEDLIFIRNQNAKCMCEDKERLTKAKEIIKKFSEFANLEVEYDPEHPQEHTDLWNKLCEEAEQFLNSEVEK